MSKMISFAVRFPEAASFWHSTRNGDLKPEDFPCRSAEKAWWQCKKNPAHVWEARILVLAAGRRCPYCSGNLVHSSNSLATHHPEVAREWHPTRNGELTPHDVTRASSKKVWWLCAEGHEWLATIGNRTADHHCPYCTGYLVNKGASLEKMYPDVAAEWHPGKNRHFYSTPATWHGKQNRRVPIDQQPEKNRRLKPADLSPYSSELVWWRCKQNAKHEWIAKVCDRTLKQSSCPVCAKKRVSAEYNLAVAYPKLINMWHATRNSHLKPTDLKPGSQELVWWKCARNASHVFERAVATVVRSWKSGHTGCPFCHGKAINQSNSIQNNEAMAALWHPTENLPLVPSEVTPGSRKEIWWRCPKGPDHVWKAKASSISRSVKAGTSGCPFCRGLSVAKDTSLANKYPALCLYWDSEKNGLAQPKDYTAGSHYVAHWRCMKNKKHRWEKSIHLTSTAWARGSLICPQCKNDLSVN